MSSTTQIAILAGPTASGKTALACRLAALLDAEIVSADSQQCYRGLDAGTAKPTFDEQQLAPHHLLDIAWPEEQLDVAQFIEHADAAIRDVRARRKRVLVVGGTGLWIRALVQGLVEAPGRDELFRAQLREKLEREGLESLHAELQRVDPAAAARILPGDRVRIERALEVFATSGRTLSSLQQRHRFADKRYRARVVLLDPPRDVLAERIAARTTAMFSPAPDEPMLEPQLLRETRWLRARIAEIPAAEKALGLIGYGEAAAVLDAPEAGKARARELAIEQVAARTRQYAKRQRSWFKKDAPALDEARAPLALPPAAAGREASPLDDEAALSALCSALRGWYEGAQ